jgi:hypothetical protein
MVLKMLKQLSASPVVLPVLKRKRKFANQTVNPYGFNC